MRKTILAIALLTSAGAYAAAADENVPLVGLDAHDNPIQVFVKKKSVEKKLASSIESVQESTLPVLKEKSAKPGWNLRTAVVGVSATAEFGIDGILKLGVAPRFRVAFSNAKDPVLP